MKKKLRIHLGIIVNNQKDARNYMKKYYPLVYEKIRIINDCYINLIKIHPSYYNLPIFNRDFINDLFSYQKQWTWEFVYFYNYSTCREIELIIKNKKTKHIVNKFLNKYPSISHYNKESSEIEKIIFNQTNINWDEMLNNIHTYCPSCRNTFNLKGNGNFYEYKEWKIPELYGNVLIRFRELKLENSRIIFKGIFNCYKCTIKDSPRNKQLIKYLPSDLDELIVELWKLNNQLGIKYYPSGMTEIIEKSSGNNIPRFVLFVLKKASNKRLEWIILLKLLKQKLSSYLNNLFKRVFEYI